MIKLMFFLILTVLLAGTVKANNIYCSGKIKRVHVSSNGAVFINPSWRSDYLKICNLNDQSPGTVTCSMWASYAAKAVENQMDVTHSLVVPEGTTCQNIPTYGSTPKTNYLMLKN